MTGLRAAQAADLPRLLELEALCFHPPWTASMVTSELDSPDARVTVWEREGRVLAYAVLHRAGDQAELYRIAADPSCRRQGIGRLLMARCDADAAALDCGSIYLEVRRSNAPAIALYESSGYQGLGCRKNYYDTPVEDALLYVKELTL